MKLRACALGSLPGQGRESHEPIWVGRDEPSQRVVSELGLVDGFNWVEKCLYPLEPRESAAAATPPGVHQLQTAVGVGEIVKNEPPRARRPPTVRPQVRELMGATCRSMAIFGTALRGLPRKSPASR